MMINKLIVTRPKAITLFWVLLAAPGFVLGQIFYVDNGERLPGASAWIEAKADLPPYSPPKTPDGTPNFQGQWGGIGGDGTSYLEAHEYLDPTTPAQDSFVSYPEDGVVPYTPWGLQRRQEILAGLGQNWSGLEDEGELLYTPPSAYCLEFMPVFSFENTRIIQRPDSVILLGGTTYRVVYTDGRPHLNEDVKLWFGSSRGHWEGDTLVVEVSNLNGMGWFDMSGLYYTENTRFIERWTMVDADTIDYEITVVDPTIYTQPWKMNFAKRRPGTGPGRVGTRMATAVNLNAPRVVDPYAGEAWETSCYEGNRMIQNDLHSLGYQWFRGVNPPSE